MRTLNDPEGIRMSDVYYQFGRVSSMCGCRNLMGVNSSSYRYLTYDYTTQQMWMIQCRSNCLDCLMVEMRLDSKFELDKYI